MRVSGSPHHHVLYVELPTGQVSFHTGYREDGPDYGREWDGVKGASAGRVCQWAAQLLGDPVAPLDVGPQKRETACSPRRKPSQLDLFA
jgi:hypothetical protein